MSGKMWQLTNLSYIFNYRWVALSLCNQESFTLHQISEKRCSLTKKVVNITVRCQIFATENVFSEKGNIPALSEKYASKIIYRKIWVNNISSYNQGQKLYGQLQKMAL